MELLTQTGINVKPFYLDESVAVYHTDSLEAVESLADESVDLIVTDPPYWTLDKWRNVGTTTRLGGNSDPEKQSGWFQTIDTTELWNCMCELDRILRNNCHCYLMSDGQMLRTILGYAEELFKNFKPIVWDKVNQGMGYHYRCRHEFFVMLDKGKNRKLNSLSTPDIWTVPMIRGGVPDREAGGVDGDSHLAQYSTRRINPGPVLRGRFHAGGGEAAGPARGGDRYQRGGLPHRGGTVCANGRG